MADVPDPIDSDELEIDYYRKLMRSVPDAQADPAAHLAWLRMAARVLSDAARACPRATLALVAHHRDLAAVFADWCGERSYERCYESGISHHVMLLGFHARRAPSHLADVIRTELAVLAVRDALGEADRAEARRAAGLYAHRGHDVIDVRHDPINLLQTIDGYTDTTLHAAGALLWYLGAQPSFPLFDAPASPGIVLLRRSEAEVELRFVKA